MKKRDFKRVVVISDLHCGHRVGLTPPAWQLRPADDAEPQRMKWVHVQQECWRWYESTIQSLKPIDVLIVNGDCLDGTGYRSGGTELITTDPTQQIEMAARCITEAKAGRVQMVRGTPYHTGEQGDMEDLVAGQCGAKIGDHEWFDVNGLTLDVKHFVGASNLPHTRATALLRDQLWNTLWAVDESQPMADVVIRSHVHYHVYAGAVRAGRQTLAMTTPALQGLGTKFGARRCSGTVHFGLVHFDVQNREMWSWNAHLMSGPSQRASALPL